MTMRGPPVTFCKSGLKCVVIWSRGSFAMRPAADADSSVESIRGHTSKGGVPLHHRSDFQQVDDTERTVAAQCWLPMRITAEKGEAIS
jgi:hypothetical protein